MGGFDNTTCMKCGAKMSARDKICPNGHSEGKNLVIGVNESINIEEGYTRIIERKTIVKNFGALAILIFVIATGIYISLNSSGIPVVINGIFLAFLSVVTGFYTFSRFHFKDRDTVRTSH